jgi:hypothetical protein
MSGCVQTFDWYCIFDVQLCYTVISLSILIYFGRLGSGSESVAGVVQVGVGSGQDDASIVIIISIVARKQSTKNI